MPRSRQLVAIMFTDMVGYTEIMEEDEERAFKLLNKNRTIQRPVIEERGGQWLKEIGDGVLASFNTVSDAIYAAGEIQKLCNNDGELLLRIGIHVGEVQMDSGDVFGSGVNIASRLESLAPPGGILVSEVVYKNIYNRRGITARFVEEKVLKGVKEPVKTYEIKVGGEQLYGTDQKATRQDDQPSKRLSHKDKIGYAIGVTIILFLFYFVNRKAGKLGIVELDKSVVVLPFENISNDPDQEYFVVGMMEEVINHLVKVRDLRVVPRSTAMSYHESNKSNKKIAEELGVATILHGGVRKDGNRLRISIQLIDGQTDAHLWSETYDRNYDDVLSVQSNVAMNIVSSLKIELQPEVRVRIESEPTFAVNAYDYYLKGNAAYWSSWANRDINAVYESIGYFEEAIEIDSQLSRAYIGVGRSYWWLAHFRYHNLDIPEIWRKSYENLAKAVSIDPSSGWAYSELAVVAGNWLWDTTATSKYLETAMELTPSDENVYIHYIYHYARLGHCDKIEWALKKLRQINQQYENPFNQHYLKLLRCNSNYEDLVAIAADWDFSEKISHNSAGVLFDACLHENYLEKAQELLSYTSLNSLVKSTSLVNRALYAVADGDDELVRQTIEHMEEISEEEWVPKISYAAIQASLGDSEGMYKYLEEALEERERELHNVSYFHQFNTYKDEPRFREILARMWTPMDLTQLKN